MVSFVWFLAAILAGATAHRINPYPEGRYLTFEGPGAGLPLHLTEFIKNGRAAEGRSLSLVTGLEPNITSYSGFITVDEECGSNLFFWFFPSQNDPSKDPVTVWLQGGPGSTSFFGLLTENGPYNLRLDGTLELREYSWNRNSSVIYIDNPVGTGYSYTEMGCYATDQTQVGDNLLAGLEQFFVLFPELRENELYLTGESYAGKYVPAAAYSIMKSGSSLNLKGIMIGNGLVDSRNQQNYSSYVYQLGLLDENARAELYRIEDSVRRYIDSGLFNEASALMNSVLGKVASSGLSLYNFLSNDEPEADIDAFVTQAEVRRALHVGNATWDNGATVSFNLFEDIPKSVRPWLEELMDKYRVLLYHGQLDIICAYPLAEDYFKLLDWSRADEYHAAERKIWLVNGTIAGYAKSAGDFTEVLVRNAGHMVPTNQPQWALDLLNKFINNQPIAA